MGPSKASSQAGGRVAKSEPASILPSNFLELLKSLGHSPEGLGRRPGPLTTFSPAQGPQRQWGSPVSPKLAAAGRRRVNSALRAARWGWGAGGVPVGKYGFLQWFYWKSCSRRWEGVTMATSGCGNRLASGNRFFQGPQGARQAVGARGTLRRPPGDPRRRGGSRLSPPGRPVRAPQGWAPGSAAPPPSEPLHRAVNR